MKKSYVYAFLLSGIMFFSACTSDNDDLGTTNQEAALIQDNITGLTKVEIPDGITEVMVYNWADDTFLGTATVENGHIWLGSTNGSLTVKLYNAAKRKSATRADNLTDLGYIKDATVYKSEDNILTLQAADKVNSGYSSEDFMTIFPSDKDNRNITAPEGSSNFEHDVLYTSDGNPFSIYPIYSNGWYDLTLGVFYYDENKVRHDVDIWSMKQNNWKTPYSEIIAANNKNNNNNNRPGGPNNNNNNTSIIYTVSKTENAEGYQITLPEHYVYGFYIQSNDDSQAGKYFSYSVENTCGEKHAVNIVKDGINYVAFEDQDGGDWDLNDLICYVNPKIQTISEVTPEKVAEEIKKINSVIVVPDDVDKIVHGQTADSCDVEARYDGKGHDYVRIAKPLKNDEELEIDLDNMNQYCENDDFRIVSAGDMEVIYCPNNTSTETNYKNSHLTANNGCTDKKYGKVTSFVTGKDGKKDDDGSYQVKVDMYPKNEDCFNQVVKHIESCEWDKMFTTKKTKK